MTDSALRLKNIFNTSVVVAALGYFVDVYDLVLFLIVGKPSLTDIGVPKDRIIENFQYLLNVQMIGMLVGGIFWGVLGDKKGRLSVLFGSILMYSLANVANGFVKSLDMYVFLRFIAGVGLAGELGAGITLVSEIMHKEIRGYGTMIVASVGVVGAVVAALVARVGWEIAYFIGGGLGISLLLLRIGVFESGIFQKMEERKVKKGSFFSLFQTGTRATKYLNCILVGLPVWFIIGILVGLASTFAEKLGVQGEIVDGTCVMLCYTGLVFGDLASGAISQWLKSRKRVFIIFYVLCILLITTYLRAANVSATAFYIIITSLGFSTGFWAIFVTNASEQFGTNLRATVTTTVPNFVRGSLVLVSMLFKAVVSNYGLIAGTAIVAGIVFLISFVSLYFLPETFGKDLDYVEEI